MYESSVFRNIRLSDDFSNFRIDRALHGLQYFAGQSVNHHEIAPGCGCLIGPLSVSGTKQHINQHLPSRLFRIGHFVVEDVVGVIIHIVLFRTRRERFIPGDSKRPRL